MPLYQLWNWLNLMRNRQPTARRPNSPAKHVFSAAKAHEIPLPRLLTHITAQLLDASGLLGTGHAAAAGMALRPHIRAHEDVLLVKQGGIGGCICHWHSPDLRVRRSE